MFLYQVAVTSRQLVPSFTPNLQLVPAMPLSKPLRHILSKLINAERAAYHAPKFLKLAVRLEREGEREREREGGRGGQREREGE